MNKIFKIIVFSVLGFNYLGAQNLVLNYSFEDTIPCAQNPNPYGPETAYPWFKPTSGSSDYFNIHSNLNGFFCANPINNIFGFQNPRTGNAFCGFSIYNAPPYNNSREYIEGVLSDTLIYNRQYCVSFYLSAGEHCKYITDDIGLYFSGDSVYDININSNLSFTPQITNIQGNYLNDTANWMLISGIYTAQGGEKYITIGNFKNDANTTLDTIPGAIQDFGYYFIDDVSVVDCTVGLWELKNNSISASVIPNPAKDKINVAVNGTNNFIYKIEILNMLGEVVLLRNDLMGDKNSATINITSLPVGIYVVKTATNLGFSVGKFVKD